MTQTASSPAGSFREMFRAADDRQGLCVIAILAWVASCDGAVAPRERELLDRFAEGLPNLTEVGRVIEAVIPTRPDDIELACRHVRNRMDRGGKHLLLQLAITMAVQDGFLSVGENWVLQFLADLLGVSPRKFAKLFAEISHRPFPAAGDPSSVRWWRDRQAGIPARPSPEAHGAEDRAAPDVADAPEPMTREVALRVLGLDESASLEAIHRAYRRLAKFRHPDRFAKLGPAATSAATAAFERVREAYELLSTDTSALRPAATA